MIKNQKILVYSPSGRGKTSSLRNLPPENTAIINCDRKSLPFKNWRNLYKTVRDEQGRVRPQSSNYVEMTSPATIIALLKVWEAREDIHYIAIDTLTHLITAEYMKKAIGQGFDGYQNMGKGVFDLLSHIRTMTTNIVVFAHEKEEKTELGDKTSTIKSQGKMIDGFEPPSFFTTILYSDIRYPEEQLNSDDAVPDYVFRTIPEKGDIVKVPAIFENGTVSRMFEKYIPNDIMSVFQTLDNYENSVNNE